MHCIRIRVTAVVVGAAVSMVGCASTGTVIEEAAKHPATIFQGPEAQTMYSDAPVSVTGAIPRPMAAVRTAVRQAFTDFSIPITVDNAAGQTGNTDFYRTRQFMGRPMTELVSCGSGITGPNAASFRIFMSLLVTTKTDASGNTVVAVLFQATARDVQQGTSNDRLVCRSSGRVEQLLLERITTLALK
ncbi:hypothetical protein [Gemmatimonas sp.]